MAEKNNVSEETGNTEEMSRRSPLNYDKTERDRMRFLLQKSSRIIDLIASGEVPLGTAGTVKLIDSLAEELGYEQEEQCDKAHTVIACQRIPGICTYLGEASFCHM